MAEAAVSLAIETLGVLLIQQTIQKIDFLKNVPAQIGKLKSFLIDMQSFLKSVENWQDDDPVIRNWVSKIREAAYESEDVIEAFIVEFESLNKKKSLCKRIASIPRRVSCLYRVGKEIESILEKIVECHKSRQTFDIDQNLGEGTSTRGEELRKLLRSSPFMEDKDLVGLEEKTDSLVRQLLVQDSRRRVISIVDMAGVGKTTLVRKVYNHVDVSRHFDCRAWVCVSQKCNVLEVLGGIINQVEKQSKELLEMLERMQEAHLERTLQEKLQDKCYLVVLDDILEKEAWDCLAAAFPDVNKGSRLLMTSRYEKVPQHADALMIRYKLEIRGEEDSWQLFLNKAVVDSLSSESKLSLELEDIGRKIVEKCDGLPLGISVIGRLLQGKRRLECEWQGVLDTITSHLSSGRKAVSTILALSYDDLPPDLKSYFLSFAKFLEDFAIPTRRLFHLWVAEGLIRQRGAEVLEDLAADSFDELIHRNLVQGVAVKANGMAKKCRVHDLLRDLAIAEAEEVIFLEIFRESSSSYPSSKCRHLVVHCYLERYHFPGEFWHSSPRIRSLTFVNLAKVVQEVNLSFASFKLLRVLDLENMMITNLPEEIGEVTLLRYLGLRHTEIKRLPISIDFLQDLQVLDIYSRYGLEEIPDVFWKLKNLWHLYINPPFEGGPLRFDTLKHLQTLCYVDRDDLIGNKLMVSTSIRKPGVRMEGSSRVDEHFSSIAMLENLVHLLLSGHVASPSLIDLSRLKCVKRLKLLSSLTELPSPHLFPPILSHLSLCGTQLAEDPMPALKKFEHLSILKLKYAYAGKEPVISENQFQNLTFLGLIALPNLIKIKIGRGAMPQLRCCIDLQELPDELAFMKALEKLEVVEMLKSFVTRLQGTDSYKVSHIPNKL